MKRNNYNSYHFAVDDVETNNYSEVARLNGVSVNTVRRVIARQDSDELEKK